MCLMPPSQRLELMESRAMKFHQWCLDVCHQANHRAHKRGEWRVGEGPGKGGRSGVMPGRSLAVLNMRCSVQPPNRRPSMGSWDEEAL